VRIAAVAVPGAPAGARPRPVLDPDLRLGGRGAYACRADGQRTARPECLGQAVRRGALQRALRTGLEIDPDFVESNT
jgi:predicted RNA-binding protein YlxR (DUF448 family)